MSSLEFISQCYGPCRISVQKYCPFPYTGELWLWTVLKPGQSHWPVDSENGWCGFAATSEGALSLAQEQVRLRYPEHVAI